MENTALMALSGSIGFPPPASYELLARTHRVRLNGRTILLVKSAPNHQGQLGGKVGRVLTCEPVAQSPKNHTEGSPRRSTVHSDFL